MAMGGVGEAMLLGAAMGGGSAALTGGDPLKGALLGGLTGGVGSGISTGLSTLAGNTANLAPALSSAATAVPGAAASTLPAATSVLPAAATSAAPTVAASAAPAVTSPFLSGAPMTAADTFRASISSAAPTGISGGTITPGVGSFAPTGGISNLAPETFTQGMAKFAADPMASIMGNKGIAAASALQGAIGAQEKPEGPGEYDGPLKRFRFNPETYRPAMFADGGITNLAAGGYDRMVGEQPMYQALAKGGISDLGGYSDFARGGRMLKGPGDGMSDSIPASISGKRPARLADGEFVVPADVVSHLGNGSTDAGAKTLYRMMDKVRTARTGNKKQGREINARRFVPA
jgi:hypothetical protein